jgi:hypothetical protein
LPYYLPPTCGSPAVTALTDIEIYFEIQVKDLLMRKILKDDLSMTLSLE